MKLSSIFSSSRGLFAIALGLIGFTGFGLWLTIEQFTPAPTLNNTVVSTRNDEPIEAAPVEEETEETEETDEAAVAPAPEPAPVEIAAQLNELSCTDCVYAAVDKQNSLSSSYAPVVNETGLSGGGFLTSSAVSGLSGLFAAAASDSINLEIISAYRSYATQATTFESWVQTEMANGLGREAAEIEANTYSARPGQSEHQLGTTADLKCAGCAAFDAGQNAVAYDFIAANAHLHGFVVSYPTGQESVTGYTYEPWHIRWIGVDLATNLFNTGYLSGNGNHLAKFLRDKGLSQ